MCSSGGYNLILERSLYTKDGDSIELGYPIENLATPQYHSIFIAYLIEGSLTDFNLQYLIICAINIGFFGLPKYLKIQRNYDMSFLLERIEELNTKVISKDYVKSLSELLDKENALTILENEHIYPSLFSSKEAIYEYLSLKGYSDELLYKLSNDANNFGFKKLSWLLYFNKFVDKFLFNKNSSTIVV